MSPVVLAGLLVMLQAMLLRSVDLGSWVPWTAAAIVVAAFVVRMSLPREGSPRPGASRTTTILPGWAFLPATLVAVVLVVAGFRAGGPIDEGASVIPFFVSVRLAESLVLWQSLLLVPPIGGRTLPRYFPVLAASALVSVFHRTIDPARQTAYLALAVIGAWGCVLLFRSSERTEAAAGEVGAAAPVGRRSIAVLFVCSALTAWGAAGAWNMAVHRAQRLVPGWMARAAGSERATRGYVRTGSLRSVTLAQQTDPMQVALRVYSTRVPGYLRGRVFDRYDRSRWQSSSPRRGGWNRRAERSFASALDESPAGIEVPGADGGPLFAVNQENSPPWTEMEIHNDPRRDEVFFTPLATAYVRGQGRFVATDEHGVIHFGLRADSPYTAYVAREASQASLPEPRRRRLLEPPRGIDPRIQQLADSVCRGARSTERKVDAVVAFFQDNFEYSLEAMEIPGNVEPLSYFLLNRPAAHCEFFASGAVTLLRNQGVPCRYVTGYVVTELEDEYGDYWLARNRNAHAWAEAYDESRRRWTLVEATPGMRPPDETGATTDLTAESGGVDRRSSRSSSSDYPWLDWHWWRARLDRFVRFAWRGSFALSVVVVVVVVALALMACRIWRPGGSFRVRADRRTRARRMLARVDRRLRRRDLIRLPHETLHQFARRLSEASDDDPWLRGCADWYIQYARVLYGEETIDQRQLARILPLLPRRK